MWLVLLYLSYTVPVRCLDSENNELMYKFTIVSGSPDSLNGSSTATVADFDECVEKCREDVECVLAHQETSSAPCYLFPWGSVTGVRSNASGEGGDGQVAFKVYTNQPACELNAVYLLNGKIYPIFPNDTQTYQWRIDTSEFGWTLTYLPCASDSLQEVCGNWESLRPYPDSCNNECLLTMVQLYAKLGYIVRSPNTIKRVSSWKQCLVECYENTYCGVAHFVEGSSECNMYNYGTVNVVQKTAAEEGHRLVIKLPTSNVTCELTTDQLLDDQYYLIAYRMYGFQTRQFFRVRTFPEYYMLTYYRDEEGNYETEDSGCPNMMINVGSGFRTALPLCQQTFQAPNLTQLESKQICERMGGHLMVEANADLYGRMYTLVRFESFFMHDWQLPDMQQKKMWFGLEKSSDCGGSKNSTLCNIFRGWEWAEPGWVQMQEKFKDTRLPMSWAPGEPSSDPEKKCAYVQLHNQVKKLNIVGRMDDSIEYELVATECDRRDMFGFTCGVYSQKTMGIRTYASLAEEYGLSEPCCLYDLAALNWAMWYPDDFVRKYPNVTVRDEL